MAFPHNWTRRRKPPAIPCHSWNRPGNLGLTPLDHIQLEEALMRGLLLASLAAGALALAGCGETPGCRALTGAGIGAGGGAVLGAIGGSPAAGALAGGAAGAAVGGLTSPNQVYVGRAPGCE
jgi:osmotically inducible lipoprotein OsmB